MKDGADVLAEGITAPEIAVPVCPLEPKDVTISVEYSVERTLVKDGDDVLVDGVMAPETAVPVWPPETTNPLAPLEP